MEPATSYVLLKMIEPTSMAKAVAMMMLIIAPTANKLPSALRLAKRLFIYMPIVCIETQVYLHNGGKKHVEFVVNN
jgi:hypothetical protein